MQAYNGRLEHGRLLFARCARAHFDRPNRRSLLVRHARFSAWRVIGVDFRSDENTASVTSDDAGQRQCCHGDGIDDDGAVRSADCVFHVLWFDPTANLAVTTQTVRDMRCRGATCE